ncbi:MAG: transglutaminase-like domain-containing protein [Candidatus Pacearchaeota archaeon]|nr:transglutaminase-like domain-containing protein [Candidatus Pacearchaeota archaeon]
MKKTSIFISFILFVSLFSFNSFIFSSAVLAQEFNTTIKELKLSMKISSTIHSKAEKIVVNLTLFPRATENSAVDLTTKPIADVEDEFIIFNFNGTSNFSYVVESEINNKFSLKKIKSVDLPISVPPELEIYTEATKYAVIDSYIRNKAFQLVAQNKDAFETLYNVAEYIRKNMNYSLEHQELKNASWIMQEKKGVCSHYTILFISMARALKIPARFISGVAYSNKEKAIREHAWAEAWIDNKWVPFDVTFGQYGWLDSSHVVLKKSLDAGTPSVEYKYIGEMAFENLTIKTEIINNKDLVNVPLEMKLFSYADRVGFNSYVPIEIAIKNPYDYYISVPVYVSLATGVFGEIEKVLLLKPESETKSFFIIEVPESSELEECGKECLATIEFRDKFGNSASIKILIGIDNPRISLQEAENIARLYKKEEVIDFYCKSDKEFYYNYENISIVCQAKSFRDVAVSICNQNICKNATLDANEPQEIELEVPARTVKNDSIDSMQMTCMILCIVTKEARDVVAVSCVDMKLLVTPEAKIVTFQNVEADYGSEGNLEAIIESNSNMNAELKVVTAKYNETKKIFLKKGTNIVPLEIKTWKLNIGENSISLILNYKDMNNESYESKKDFVFIVKNINIFNKFLILIAHLFN